MCILKYTLYFGDKRTSIRNLSRARSSEFNREKHGHWDAAEHDDFRTIFHNKSLLNDKIIMILSLFCYMAGLQIISRYVNQMLL